MTTDTTIPVSRRLPILAVVTRSYGYVWDHRVLFAVPVAMLCLAQIAASVLLRSPHLEAADSPTAAATLGAIFGFVAKLAITMAFAVGVHRTVLLNEDRGGIGFFRWDAALGRYFGATAMIFLISCLYILAIALIGFVCAVVIGAAEKLLGGGIGIALSIVVGLAGIVGYALVTGRFLTVTLALPAAALGADQSIATAWRAGRGNSWRLFGAVILAYLPFLVASLIIEAPYFIDAAATLWSEPHASMPAPGLGLLALNSLVTAVSAPVLITVVSLSYDVLVRGGGPQPEAR